MKPLKPLHSRLIPKAHAVWGTVETVLKRRGGLFLWIFALLYYALYHNAGLTLTGEAGSNSLIALRILEGWRPIKDMFVGYNLLWFYPITGIFHFTGPNLWATQVFFMLLSALTAWLGFLIVRRSTGSGGLAFGAAVLMVLMPGALFRNYMGFLAVFAAFGLIKGYVVEAATPARQAAWMAFAGFAMGVCFLIRIEPSLLITVVWAGVAILYPWGYRSRLAQRMRTLACGTLAGILTMAAVHLPFVIVAQKQGFQTEFLGQYRQLLEMLVHEFRTEFATGSQSPAAPAPVEQQQVPKETISPVATAQAGAERDRDGRRARPDAMQILRWEGAPFFNLAIHLPLLSAAILALTGGLLTLRGAILASGSQKSSGLAILVTTGCALSLFPQYFFFRPDSVHLAEFMVPFYPALACGAAAGWALRSVAWLHPIGSILPVCAALQVVVAFNGLFNREGSGSIRSARGKTASLDAGPAGVFRVKPGEQANWQGLLDTIRKNSRTGEDVVTYPYVPVLNILTQRPSYQFKLYVDNATELPDFCERAIEELNAKKPAVVVINNRDINKTEHSRFRNWAAPFYNHVATHYRHAGTFFGLVEVFVRPGPSTSGDTPRSPAPPE